MKRRTFLGTTAAFAVYGFRDCFGQQDGPSVAPVGKQGDKQGEKRDARPLFLRRALADMKSSGRAGVVLVVPDDAQEKRALGQFLFEFAEHHAPMHELWSQDGAKPWKPFVEKWRQDARDCQAAAVVICLPRAVASALYDVEEGGAAVLLDPDGREIARRNLDKQRRFEARYLSRLLELIRGDRLTHLKRIARSAERRLSDEQRVSLRANLDVLANPASHAGRRSEATDQIRVLGRRAGTNVLLALESARQTSTRERMRKLLHEITQSKSEGRLPFGAKMPDWVSSGCGSHHERQKGEKNEGVMIACGMAMPTREGRKFVRFVK